jgi:hypothetical protein
MQHVNVDDVPLVARETVRADRIDYRRLLAGSAGTPGNFKLVLVTTYAGYNGVRHRHNFDQIKLQFEGVYDHYRIGKMTPGMVGYFPEGTYYGPFTSSEETLLLLLQFGGASGAGYMSDEEYNRSMNELKLRGTYADGVYVGVDEQGNRIRKDGYEATWENAYRRPIAYQRPRYTEPVLIHPENFSWTPVERGCKYKLLGDFTERGTRLGIVQLEPGTTQALAPNSIYYVLSGEGSGEKFSWRAQSSIHVEEGEVVRITAEAASELFHMRLPSFALVPSAEYAELAGARGN